MSQSSTGVSIEPRHLGLQPFQCPGCGPSLLLRVGADEMLTRCVRCRGTPVHLSLITALKAHAGDLSRCAAYELSTTGAVLAYLRRHCRDVVTSEYLQDVEPGSTRAGMRCEDVQRLSFADGSFDLCTSTEVFEHVPGDLAGFRELHRVLRPGGKVLFTVPMSGAATTVERARIEDGETIHLHPPAFHGDRINGPGTVLVYRDYGADIVERLRAEGFSWAALWVPQETWFGHVRTVVVASRD